MSNKTNNNSGKKNELGSKLLILAVSLVLAIICWVAVVATVSTEQTRIIYSIPVTVPGNPAYRSYGIEIVGDRNNLAYIDVTVKGDRSVVSGLNPSAFTVTPNFAGINKAGTYDVALQISQNNPLLSFDITHVSLSSIKLDFAEVENKLFSVTASAEGIVPDEGYILGKLGLSQGTVLITGPVTELEQISSVKVSAAYTGTVTDTVTETCPIKIYDKEGNELDATNLIFSVKDVEVTVPVYKTGKLKLAIDFINIPDGFDVSSINYKLSHTEITVAAPKTIMDAQTTRIVGYIDLTTIGLDSTYSFDLVLPGGMICLDEIESVQVTFPRQGLSSKKIVISDIRFENTAENLHYSVESASINGVTVIANDSIIDNISSGSAVAVIDASSLPKEKGRYTASVNILIPAFSSAWAVGSYTVLVTVE